MHRCCKDPVRANLGSAGSLTQHRRQLGVQLLKATMSDKIHQLTACPALPRLRQQVRER